MLALPSTLSRQQVEVADAVYHLIKPTIDEIVAHLSGQNRGDIYESAYNVSAVSYVLSELRNKGIVSRVILHDEDIYTIAPAYLCKTPYHPAATETQNVDISQSLFVSEPTARLDTENSSDPHTGNSSDPIARSDTAHPVADRVTTTDVVPSQQRQCALL